MSALSIGKAWDESSRFLSKEIRLIVPVALAFFTVPTMIVRWANPGEQVNGPAVGLLVPVLVLLAALIGYMTIAALALGWSGSLGGAIAKAFRQVWGVFGALMLVAIPIVIIATLALVGILAGAGITDPSQLTPAALGETPGFGALAFALFVLLLLLGSRLFPLSAVAMAETASPIRLLGRSWRLTKGHFGRLIVVFALLLIAEGVARLAMVAVVGSIVTLTIGAPQPFNLAALIIALAVGVTAAAIWSIGAALVGKSYVQLSAGEASVPEVKREK